MAKTLGERLKSVQAAIEKAERSQSYEIDGRKLTRADLATLYKQEEKLIKEIEKYGEDYIPGEGGAAKRKSRIVFV